MTHNTEQFTMQKPRAFSLFKKKMQKTFISPYLDLENSYSFNLQNLGKHFKCQNTHAECDLAYKHQRSEKFTKIL